MLNKSFESLLETYNYSVMYQFWTCAFNTVVHWSEFGEVENECTSYNFGLFACHLSAKNYQIWWKFDVVITKIILLVFFIETRCSIPSTGYLPFGGITWHANDSWLKQCTDCDELTRKPCCRKETARCRVLPCSASIISAVCTDVLYNLFSCNVFTTLNGLFRHRT